MPSLEGTERVDDVRLKRLAEELSRDHSSFHNLRDVLVAWAAYAAISRNFRISYAVHHSLGLLIALDKFLHSTCVPDPVPDPMPQSLSVTGTQLQMGFGALHVTFEI